MAEFIAPRYHLRSHGPLTPTISSSPTSPLPSPIPPLHDRSQAPTPRPCTPGRYSRYSPPRSLKPHKPRPKLANRKRRFSELRSNSDELISNDSLELVEVDLHLNVALSNKRHKTLHALPSKDLKVRRPTKAQTPRALRSTRKSTRKLSVRFTLHSHHITSLPITISASSPIIADAHLRAFRDIQHFAQPPRGSSSARNPFICRYALANGFEMGIASTLGAAADLKVALKILAQDLAPARCKASVQSKKNTFLLSVKCRGDVIGCGVLQVDHVWKRVNIEMFGVDREWRGNGLASAMVYLVQMQMRHYRKYDLFVSAAESAVPFWSNAKYCFCPAHMQILEQHEIQDEKSGGVRHYIWFGDADKAGANLLRCFLLMK